MDDEHSNMVLPHFIILWLLGTKPSNKGQITEDASFHSKSAFCWMTIFNEDQGFNILLFIVDQYTYYT